jgi:hypothetical protein
MDKLDDNYALTDEEVLKYIDEVEQDYKDWNINLDILVSNLSDNNKIFLVELSELIGDKILYMLYGYLNADNLIEYDEDTAGGMSEFIEQLNNEDTLRLIELFVDFKKQTVALTKDEVDIEIIIKQLKRDVATLKKKIAQPSIYINTRQFEERFGLTMPQQKSLRGKIHDPLPFTSPNGKTILYESILVEKWLENYKKKFL